MKKRAKEKENYLPKSKQSFGGYMKRYWQLYALLFLPLLYLLIFKYIPILYVQIAFKKYQLGMSVWDMPLAKHAGMEYFMKAFKSNDFIQALKNTVSLNFLDLIVGFPAPIIFALILNELVFKRFKRVVQTIAYMPHFLSWVIIYGLALQLFAPSTGFVNMIIQNMGKTLQYYEKYPSYVNGYDDKIVLLGAWYNDDIHDTIIGQQPGVVIVYNAFLALCNRDNHVPFWISLLVFIVIWLEIMFIFREAYLPAFRQKHKGNEWVWRWKAKLKELRKEHPYIWQTIDIMAELISFATPLAILMIVVYLCTGLFVNIIIVGFFLGCINLCRKRLILYCK